MCLHFPGPMSTTSRTETFVVQALARPRRPGPAHFRGSGRSVPGVGNLLPPQDRAISVPYQRFCRTPLSWHNLQAWLYRGELAGLAHKCRIRQDFLRKCILLGNLNVKFTDISKSGLTDLDFLPSASRIFGLDIPPQQLHHPGSNSITFLPSYGAGGTDHETQVCGALHHTPIVPIDGKCTGKGNSVYQAYHRR